jgi:NitT/TauT family transport system ATP-binding protein
MSGSPIQLTQVHKRYADGLLALQDVGLRVEPGEFVTLLGPSGCGKSTVLRLVAGLESPTEGQVDAPALKTGARGPGGAETAFVFQDPTLMPWAPVFDNVWLPLRLAGRSRAEAAPLVRAQLAAVGLGEFERAYPAQLSGGMKMRASIARALVTRPQVLLMDEPFAALDEFTRQKLNDDLLAWWQAGRLSVLFVTHSVFEAVFLSQRVLVMGARPGRVLAELVVDEPYPRSSAFRTSTRYAEICRRATQALETAHGAAGAHP